MPVFPTFPLAASLAACALLALGPTLAQDAPPNRPRPNVPRVHALVNARVIPAPGEVVENATIVIRDGVIERIGADVSIPPDARLWDMTGRTVHAGFIDLSVRVSPGDLPDSPGRHWNSRVRPEASALDGGGPSSSVRESLRRLGFASAMIVPGEGVFRGRASVVSLSDPDVTRAVYDEFGPQVIAFQTGGRGGGYPSSLMGSIALIRQTLYDADWYAECVDIYRADPEGLEPPAPRDALTALRPAVRDGHPVVIETSNELDLLRADRLRDEFGLNVLIRGSGDEFKRLNEVTATGLPIILPINFPGPPRIETLEDADNVTLRTMMEWEQSPTNPRRLIEAGATVALTTDQLRNRNRFIDNLRDAIHEGLTEEQALAALTTVPASLLGLDAILGTVEPGKVANLTVIDGRGDLFGNGRRVREVWVDGHRYEITAAPTVDARGTWTIAFNSNRPEHGLPAGANTGEDGPEVPAPGNAGLDAHAPAQGATLRLTGRAEAPRVDLDVARRTARARNVSLRVERLNFTVPGSLFGREGWEQFSGLIEGDRMRGLVQTADGQRLLWTARRQEAHIAPGLPGEDDPDPDEPTEAEQPDEPPADDPQEQEEPEETRRPRVARAEQETERDEQPARRPRRERAPKAYPTPLGAYGLTEPLQSQNVLVRGATIWTAGPAGIIPEGDLFIEDGKVKYVGPTTNWAWDPGDEPLIINARGKHITPGLIDCHSHTGIERGVNEGTHSITAEVRIEDVIVPDSIDWYRQLAGGLTVANQLHGSANPMGGQNSVVKLRWGEGPDGFRFEGAPAGIKFALGENVVRANSASPGSRYPLSRMGVEAIMRSAFHAARDYEAQWRRFAEATLGVEEGEIAQLSIEDLASASSVLRGANPGVMSARREYPPRRDLQLDALVEILNGQRLVHCHSYRQDEILAFIRLADDFGFTIGTLQHILEGYKVATEIAYHGAGASAFSDWWAFKIEVYEAIPYAGALMHRAGVNVSFNSDSNELARRMNTEASKAVRYGRIEPHEALKFVTLNPAIQLGIADRVGSLEIGKDGDFAIWSGDPLSTLSRCEQTWIEGVRLFSIERDAELREEAQRERQRLIQRILGVNLREPQTTRRRDDGPGGAQPPDGGMLAELMRLRMLHGHDPNAYPPGECGCFDFYEGGVR